MSSTVLVDVMLITWKTQTLKHNYENSGRADLPPQGSHKLIHATFDMISASCSIGYNAKI